MKLKALVLLSFIMVCLTSCTEEKMIELPLERVDGFGPFNSSSSGIDIYYNDEDNPWKETELKIIGIPEHWKKVKYGHIETDIYQTIYQNYFQGNISLEFYRDLQKSGDWKPDSLLLSKKPIKCRIALAYGTDSLGFTEMIVDVNNNRDLSDDFIYTPASIFPNQKINQDSLAKQHTIQVNYEYFKDGKTLKAEIPLYIAIFTKHNMFMYNFPQYSTTQFEGIDIAVRPDGFADILYKRPEIALIKDKHKKGEKFQSEDILEFNEYIELNGKLYINKGVKPDNKTLVLEKVSLSKDQIRSSQVGYQPFPFKGKEFTSESLITLEKYKGKYVLLDFWSIWCGPCLEELPSLKKLYDKTNRSDFEMVGIVEDCSEAEFNPILKKDSIHWPQILSTDSNQIKETYGIHGFPTTFLINPEGKIIAKDLRGEELEQKVLSLLKK